MRKRLLSLAVVGALSITERHLHWENLEILSLKSMRIIYI